MTTVATQTRDGLLKMAHENVTLTLSTDHDPQAYYQTRPGLVVWDDFLNYVVWHAKTIAAGATFSVNIATLENIANDFEIEAALPERHFFDKNAVCGIVAELISKQSEGESGLLEHTGCGNLLYMPDCVVIVFRVATERKWDVDVWPRGGCRWNAGFRVLSPANPVDQRGG